MPIHILADEVASQIAAGEVVERPASVVKELLENALDSSARQVEIAIEAAGRRTIEVSDDGCGIPAGELELAVARHATSKLSSADDLFHMGTLGFRGEALASIASVSRFTLTSRQPDAEVGARLVVEGGRVGELQRVGTPPGTTVRVEDLFYNVPARLKFLKQDPTERQAIDALVTRYAMAYPDVRFRLKQEDRPAVQTTGSGSRREVLTGLYGVELGRQMLEVVAREEDIAVSGFISPISLTRSNRREITLFVNGRWVQDSSLAAALMQAYHNLLMVGRYPLAVLFLKIAPELVDVNVHPAKAEVRFRSQERVFSVVQRAVRRALLAYSPVPAAVPASTWSGARAENNQAAGPGWLAAGSAQHSGPQIDPAWDMAADLKNVPAPGSEEEDILGMASSAPAQGPEIALAPGGAVQQPLPSAGRLPLLRLVGQVGAAYLVAEGPDGLYLIDQHAAHERVLFERFMNQSAAAVHLPAQALLQPVTLQLPPQSAQALTAQLGLIDKLGFQVESFGPHTFLVRAIPALILGSDPAAALRVLVEDFEEDETPLQAELEARLIARVCKRAAVKAGHVLTLEEQHALLIDLENCTSPRTCPHGRPTMIHLPADLLERQFGRRGAR